MAKLKGSGNVKPKLLADDIFIQAKGKGMEKVFAAALKKTHTYLHDMGAKNAPAKSFNYGSTAEARQWLRDTLWSEISSAIEVVEDYRYLGAHISTDGRGHDATWVDRVAKAVATTAKIARLPIGAEDRAKVLRAKVIPAALYGVETVPTRDKQVSKLTAAFVKALTRGGPRHDVDLVFSSHTGEVDLDPQAQILLRRIMTRRRVTAKKKSVKNQVQRILERYVAEGAPIWDGTQSEEEYNEIMAGLEPAPHPIDGSTAKLSSITNAQGPIGYLLQMANCMAMRMDIDGRLHQAKEAMLDIFDTPYQHMPKLVCQIAARARTKARAKDKDDNALKEIDVMASFGVSGNMDEEQAKILRVVQNKSAWDKDRLTRIGVIEDDTCEYCGVAIHTSDHIIWRCPHFQPQRQAACPRIAAIAPDHFSNEVRMGIAPAMSVDGTAMYWGGAYQGGDPEEAKLLGVKSTEDLTGEARELAKHAKEAGANARQIVACARQEHGGGHEPDFEQVDQPIMPEQPNVYTDGSLTSPKCHMWALGGYGIWWPTQGGRHQQQHTNMTILRGHICDDGIMQYGHMSGQKASSTRMEIAGVIEAMTAKTAIHAAADSQAMKTKMDHFIEVAEEVHRKMQEGVVARKRPSRKPWNLQPDGDLWEIVWKGLIIKGPDTLRVTKVKGHATDAEVEAGLSTEVHQIGNRRADTAADHGVEGHRPGLVSLAAWCEKRHDAYCIFMAMVQKIIVTVMLEERKQRKEKREMHAMVTGIKGQPPVVASCRCNIGQLEGGVEMDIAVIKPNQHCKDKHHAYMQTVAAFMKQFKWSKSQPEVGGITWRELYILFDSAYPQCTRRDMEQESKEQEKANKTLQMVRDNLWKNKRRNMMTQDERSKRRAKARQRLKDRIEYFKKVVRRMARYHLRQDQRGLLAQDPYENVRRLKVYGVIEHTADVAAMPNLTAEQKETVAAGIVSQRRNIPKKTRQHIIRKNIPLRTSASS